MGYSAFEDKNMSDVLRSPLKACESRWLPHEASIRPTVTIRRVAGSQFEDSHDHIREPPQLAIHPDHWTVTLKLRRLAAEKRENSIEFTLETMRGRCTLSFSWGDFSYSW